MALICVKTVYSHSLTPTATPNGSGCAGAIAAFFHGYPSANNENIELRLDLNGPCLRVSKLLESSQCGGITPVLPCKHFPQVSIPDLLADHIRGSASLHLS
jgi:hypothetical protein